MILSVLVRPDFVRCGNLVAAIAVRIICEFQAAISKVARLRPFDISILQHIRRYCERCRGPCGSIILICRFGEFDTERIGSRVERNTLGDRGCRKGKILICSIDGDIKCFPDLLLSGSIKEGIGDSEPLVQCSLIFVLIPNSGCDGEKILKGITDRPVIRRDRDLIRTSCDLISDIDKFTVYFILETADLVAFVDRAPCIVG